MEESTNVTNQTEGATQTEGSQPDNTPMTPPPADSNAGPVPGMNQQMEPQQKSKGTMTAIIIVCALIVVLAIAAVIVALSLFSSPKSKVFKAVAVTMADTDTSFAEYLGIEELTKLTTQGAYSSELELMLESIEDGSMTDYSMASGIGLNAQNSMDYDAKKLTSDIKLLYNGANLLEMNIFGDDTIVGVAMPGIYEGALAVNMETFMHDYNELWRREFGETVFVEEHDLNIFEVQPDADSFSEAYAEDLKNIYEVIEVTKTDERRTVNVKGKEQECVGYEVIVPQQAAEVLALDMIDYVKTISMSTEEDSIQELEETLLEQIDKDITYMIYLDKSGRMVAMEFEYALEYDEEEKNCRADMEWAGTDHLWNDFKIDIACEDVETGEIITLNVWHTLDKENEEIRRTLNADMGRTVNDSSNAVNLVYKSSVDTTQGNTRAMITFEEDEEELLKMDMQGAFSDVKAGEQYRFHMDSLDLSMSEYTFSLSGSYALGDLKEEIVLEDNRLRYILEMDESEMEELANEMIENIWNSPLVTMMFSQ